jgi:hypothetical protein
MSTIASLSETVDALIQRFGASEHDAEVSEARDGYCERRGRVFEEEEAWENFTQGFLEWYVVERPSQGGALSPAALVAQECEPGERKEALRALASSQRCLAIVSKIGKQHLDVEDLVGGAHFRVSEERHLAGVEVGNVVEMRLIGFKGQVHLGRSLLFHPKGTLEAISDAVHSMLLAGKGRGEVIDSIALLRSRALSYQHVSPVRIYNDPGIIAGVRQ